MEPDSEEKLYSTMIPHHSHDSNNPSPLSPLNTNLNPTLLINPHTNPTTFVENANDDYQQLNHRQTITNNVSNNVIRGVNNNMGGLSREEWPLEYPPGYRFCPEDGELIVYYLRRKIMNLNLPHDKIKDVNLYRTTPDIVTEEHEPVGDNEWYFFTPRDRKYRNGRRPNRAAGGTGYWKATGADKPIRFNGELVGFRKALVFYEGKAPKGLKTNFIMHEYKVNDTTERIRAHPNDMRLDDWVLCRIYNKTGRAPKPNTKSEINPEPSPGSSTDDEGLVQPLPVVVEPVPVIVEPVPEIVKAEDENPFHPFPNTDFIVDDDVFNSMLSELFFNNCDMKNPLDSLNHDLSPNPFFDRLHTGSNSSFYNLQCNDFNVEVKPLTYNTVPLVENKYMRAMEDLKGEALTSFKPMSLQDSTLIPVPVEQVNKVCSVGKHVRSVLKCYDDNLEKVYTSPNSAPSQKLENLEEEPNRAPSKKQKSVP